MNISAANFARYRFRVGDTVELTYDGPITGQVTKVTQLANGGAQIDVLAWPDQPEPTIRKGFPPGTVDVGGVQVQGPEQLMPRPTLSPDTTIMYPDAEG